MVPGRHGTRKHETAADFTYSSGKLDQVLADLSCFDPQQAVPPKDAYVEDDGSAFVVIPEQEGTTLDPEKTPAGGPGGGGVRRRRPGSGRRSSLS